MGLTPTVLEGLTEAVTVPTAYSVDAAYCSLHSANPGLSGTNELSSSAYARQPVSFTGSPGGGQDTTNTTVSFGCMSGDTAKWYGFWDSLTAGNFIGGFPLVGTPQLCFTMPSLNAGLVYCPAHGLAPGQRVRMFPEPGVQGTSLGGYTTDLSYQVATAPSVDTLNFGLNAVGAAAFWLGLDYSNAFTALGLYTIPVGNLIYQTVS